MINNRKDVAKAAGGKETALRKFGIVTDEIDRVNLEAALKVMKDLGASYADLNTVGGKNIFEHSKEEVREMRKLLDSYEIKPTVLSTPFIKGLSLDDIPTGKVADHPEFRKHLEMLRCTMEIAHMLCAPMVRTFSFKRPVQFSPPHGGEIDDETFGKVMEGIRMASGLAEQEGIKLVLENVNSVWGNTGYNMARIIRAVDSPAFGAIWDVANAYVSGETSFLDGYSEVKDLTFHVHVKDATIVDAETGKTRWECMGRGGIDYVGQFKALAENGYDGVICLETHWNAPGMTREQCTRESFSGLMELIRQANEPSATVK
ncbi:sugar phosphate isomerase/epimerase [Paenibacillus sp. GYB004]|uniref:sugar phosphate isomerase/epimerase family protein n=1 Tax=Paenibacillus sp. GYB004 TaxID=2994393 RepID=UPI002F96D29A